jgi:hypothetical protein
VPKPVKKEVSGVVVVIDRNDSRWSCMSWLRLIACDSVKVADDMKASDQYGGDVLRAEGIVRPDIRSRNIHCIAERIPRKDTGAIERAR